MRHATSLYLPYADWPEDDRTRWEAAFKLAVDRFDDSGPAAHLAEPTRLTLLDDYGRFLAFLSAHDVGLLARTSAARIDRKIIESYVRRQPASCGGVTIARILGSLRTTLRYICPGHDWSWISTIAKRIAAQAKQKPEKHHLVTSETLYALGIELMDRAIANANAAENISIACALGYRDGLMIALLALIPLRRRTLAALHIGKQLVRSGDRWALDIPARDIKTKRPLEYPISAELSGRIDLYLNQFRCRIPGAGAHDYLWASKEGGPMFDKTIYATVRRRTRETLGFSR
jgi:integrase/recombinase XerD